MLAFRPRALNAVLLLVLIAGLLTGGCVPPSPSAPGTVSAEQAQTDVWIKSLAGLTPAEQARRAEQIWRDTSKPRLMRDRAAYLLSTRPGAQTLAAQQALARTYATAALAQRKSMERLLMADLLTTDDASLRRVSKAPAGQEKVFPWSMILWQAARHGLLADNAGTLKNLSDPRLYADPSLLGLRGAGSSASGSQLVPSESSGIAGGMAGGSVALVLPLSGPFAAIGKQVAAGADVAAQSLAAQGVNIAVRIIDTERPDWLDQLNALPPDCVVVGGPLRADSYATMKTKGVSGRVLFAFLPQLPVPAEEGVAVWRFFTSPQDQIDAVLNVATHDLGVSSFGVFSPQEPYGQRVAGLFLQAAQQRGLPVSSGSYSPTDMASWTKASGSFVDAVAIAQGQIPQARASFEAIFLPDSWKNMDMLISTLHYHGASKKIMLGTALWEQGLASAKGLNPATFALTVFPGVWNARAENAAAVALKGGMTARQTMTDDWAVLGFDFVQFAAALGLKTLPSAPELNARLAAGVALDWAGAPMVWNGQGQASRRLFLFQPTRDGMMPLNAEAFRNYRAGTGPMPNVEVPVLPSALSEDGAVLPNDAAGGATPAATPALQPVTGQVPAAAPATVPAPASTVRPMSGGVPPAAPAAVPSTAPAAAPSTVQGVPVAPVVRPAAPSVRPSSSAAPAAQKAPASQQEPDITDLVNSITGDKSSAAGR